MTDRGTMADEPIDRWLDALASGLIEPAAEAFASLAAVSGAALVVAVARRGALHFSEPGATRMVEIQLEADAARDTLFQLADSNAAAYEAFLEILRGSADRDADRTARLVALREALETTIDGQLQTARRAVYLMGMADEVTRAGDANTAADGLSAAASLHAATVAATADIEINAFAVAEPARRAELAETCTSLRERAAALLATVEDSFHAASKTT
ncbi:MAG: cyclodeaminase/cyclohydrolase family protein [Actinomycetota bacterium]